MSYYYQVNTQGFELHVESPVQKALFLQELSGQISDGYWEDARPIDHYQYWSLSFDQVIVDGTLSHNFYAPRKYNFLASDLLGIVGDRMLFYAKMTILFPDVAFALLQKHNMPDDVEELQNVVRYAANGEEYWINKLAFYTEIGLTQDVLDAVEAYNGYDMQDLRKDLQALKTAVNS